MTVKLTKLEYLDYEIAASFDLNINIHTMAAQEGESRAHVSALVFFPCPYGDALRTDAGREAHAQLLEHLESLAQELRGMIQP